MAGKQCTDEVLLETLNAYRETGGNLAATARALGLTRDSVKNRLMRCRVRGLAVPKLSTPKARPQPAELLDSVPDPEQKPSVRVRYQQDDLKDYLVVGIGDAHDSPRLEDKSRFRWLGKFCADIKSDMIVQIGDFFTLDSLCRYEGNETLRGKSKPAFLEDMASGQEALDTFDEGLDGYECLKHETLGNHEDRVWSFTDRTPEIAGMMQLELDRLLARHGWTYSMFGHPYFIGGVAFIHSVMSIMGRPIGGELSGNTVTLKATHDWVYGHDHRGGLFRRPKIGVNNSVSALDLGCALPQGHIEPYAAVSTTGWTYGCWEIRISKGRIQSAKEHTMSELEERYG